MFFGSVAWWLLHDHSSLPCICEANYVYLLLMMCTFLCAHVHVDLFGWQYSEVLLTCTCRSRVSFAWIRQVEAL